GLEPGTEVNFNVGNAYNPMEDLSGSATADDLGIAEYTVYDNDGSIYVGGYGTTVTLNDGTQVAQGNFEVTDDDDGETPISEPEITLDPAEVYQGEQVGLSGSGFTPDGEVEFVLDEEIFSGTADENGELAGAAIQVPRDLAAGTYDVLARDLETEGEATAELTVVEADEPVLRISPEEITLDEFIRDDEDDEGGVVHTVAGLEPGAEVDAVIDGPENVETVERDETANEHGVVEFVIYGY